MSMSTPQRKALWQRLAGDREFCQYLSEQRDESYRALLTATGEQVGRLQGKATFIEELVRHVQPAREG